MNKKIFRLLPTLILTVLLLTGTSPVAAQSEGMEIADSIPETATPAIPEVATPAVPSPKVTPVDVDDEKPRVVLHYFDKHGEPLQEPVRFLAVLDTVQKVKSGPTYPLYSGVNVGVNFADALFLAFGQKSASFDVWANVSLYNWIFPTIECGIGFARDHTDNVGSLYKTKPGFYAKLGINYNFLYKSDLAYQAFLGLRAGVANVRYDVLNYPLREEIHDDAIADMPDGPALRDADEPEVVRTDYRGLRSSSWFGEVLIGVQVRIVGPFSLGWTGRYHYNFHTSTPHDIYPWFIPGYGTSGHFAFSLSAIFSF